MKKTLLMLAMVAATSMIALAHGDEKDKDGKKAGCCSKDAKKELAASKSCCSKDKSKTASVSKTEKVADKAADKKETPKN